MNESFNPSRSSNPTYVEPIPLAAGDRIVAPIGGPGVIVETDGDVMLVRLDQDSKTYRYPPRLLRREEEW